jgi:hypothetical protein
MAALADLPEIVGFFSYSRDDDRDSDGGLSILRRRIQSELRGQLGRSEDALRSWQDAEAIPPGTLWESQIGGAVEQSVFFIPIITPRVIQSKYCQVEFERFLARETVIGRNDLVFPILYIDVPQLKDERRWREHPVLSAIGARQYVDWCDFRFELDSPNARRAIAAFCRIVVAALERQVPDPRAEAEEKSARERAAQETADREREAERVERERAEERRKREETEAQARSDEDRNRQRAEEEQRRLAAEEQRRLVEARRREEESRAPQPEDATPSPLPSATAPASQLARAAEFGLVVQGAFSLIGLVLALIYRFEAEVLFFLVPAALSIGAGVLLHRKGLSTPGPRYLIAATALLNLSADIFIVYCAIQFNNIMNHAPLLGLSAFTGVVIYALLILWWISVAWPRSRPR